MSSTLEDFALQGSNEILDSHPPVKWQNCTQLLVGGVTLETKVNDCRVQYKGSHLEPKWLRSDVRAIFHAQVHMTTVDEPHFCKQSRDSTSAQEQGVDRHALPSNLHTKRNSASRLAGQQGGVLPMLLGRSESLFGASQPSNTALRCGAARQRGPCLEDFRYTSNLDPRLRVDMRAVTLLDHASLQS
eukprot:1978707-Amphidinium_carterae.2